MKKFLFLGILLLPLFGLAAATRVTVIGGDSAGIRSAIAADPEFTLADWEDTPAFDRLDAEFVQARKSMPETDFLIVADPAYSTAIFNVNRACLVAEFLPSAAAALKHLRKAVAANEPGRSVSLWLGMEGKAEWSSEAEEFIGRELDRLFADRDSILLIWQPDPARSIARRTFFRFHFPMNPDSQILHLCAWEKEIKLNRRQSHVDSQLFSGYITKRHRDETIKGVEEALLKQAEKQLAVLAALPDDPREKAKTLVNAQLCGSAMEVLTTAAVASPRNALIQKTLIDTIANISVPSDYALKEQIYAIPRAALESFRRVRAAGCYPADRVNRLVGFHKIRVKETAGNSENVDWEALRQLAAELREEFRLIKRNFPLSPYNPDVGLKTPGERKLFFSELNEIDFNRQYFVTYDDFQASLKAGIRKELEFLDVFYTSREPAEQQETRTPGFLPTAGPSSEFPAGRKFEVQATYDNIEFAAQGKSRELRQLALFWEMTKYCQENTLTGEEYLVYYRNYCREVKKIYGDLKPRYEPEKHPLPVAGEGGKKLLEQRTAVVKDVFAKAPATTQTAAAKPTAPKTATRFPAPEIVQPEKWFSVQTVVVAPEKAGTFMRPEKHTPSDLMSLVPTIHGNIFEAFGTVRGMQTMSGFDYVAGYNWNLNPTGALSADQRRLLDAFNSKVLVNEVFKVPAGWLIVNSVMRQGAIYFIAFNDSKDDRVALYRFDLQKHKAAHLGEVAVRPRIFQGFNEMFDVEGKYAVWTQPAEGHFVRADRRKPGEPKENTDARLYVFDMEARKIWSLTDFPREKITSATLLDGRIYLMLNGGMLLAMDPDGGKRKVVFDKQRKESRNWFEEAGVGAVVRANPYRKTLLALGGGFCEFDPLTLTGTVFADPAEGYGISLADDTLFFKNKFYGYYSYSLKTGRYERRVMLGPESFITNSGRKAAFPHILAVKVWGQVWDDPFHSSTSQNSYSFCFQNDLMMMGRHTRIVNVKEPDQSVPLLLPRDQTEQYGADTYPASDGRSFWVVLPEGAINLVTPKGK